jgi:leader peptidase (prepilin peptidase)/N-methyltransferase
MPIDAMSLPLELSLPLETMETLAISFVYGWLFCLGATVGSFLNVVVWRLPRGRSLVHPGSLCPVCHHPIRLRDNIPVLSWLLLGGRCRDCQAPIAPRYLWVELASGAIFLGLVAWRTLGPAADPRSLDPRWLLSWELAGKFWIDYLRDVILLSTLLAAALIEADGFDVPPRLWWPAGLTGVLHPWLTWLLNSGFSFNQQATLLTGPGEALGRPWIGLLAGLAMGSVLGRLHDSAAGRGLPAKPWAGTLGVAGAVLGWRTMLPVAWGGSVVLAVGRLVGREVPLAAGVGVMVVLPLLGVDRLAKAWLPAAAIGPTWFALACGAASFAVVFWLGRLGRGSDGLAASQTMAAPSSLPSSSLHEQERER